MQCSNTTLLRGRRLKEGIEGREKGFWERNAREGGVEEGGWDRYARRPLF